ncbi:unnamed protein product [Vicia faba]|uniref:Uncharacterized protein n=1 Tax=Vicia faba TaxID=3906 RepID=A0AAV1AMZ0_VICFA|nr:unnamed protein product [Vicia faba]
MLMVFSYRSKFLRRYLSHIPLPCGAALLPLPLGTGHETHIFFETHEIAGGYAPAPPSNQGGYAPPNAGGYAPNNTTGGYLPPNMGEPPPNMGRPPPPPNSGYGMPQNNYPGNMGGVPQNQNI